MKKLMGIMVCGWSLLYSHHAMEYIEMESYSTALKGEKIFHLHYDYFVEEKDNPDFDHWEFTPGISYGITNYIMFDIHTHFSKFNKGFTKNNEEISPFIEALATSIQFRLPEFKFLDFAFVLNYEIPFKRAREYIDGKEVFEGKIILSKDFLEHSNLCFNFNFIKEGDEFLKEWAFGIKNPISSDPHGISAGIEILGDYKGSLFFLPGIYFPIENSILKTGIGFGNSKSTNLRVNLTLMYRF